MPTLRQRPDGRYFIDDCTQGERVRIALRRFVKGERVPVRDKRTAEVLFREYCDGLRKIPGDPDFDDARGDPAVRDIAKYYLDEYLVARHAAKKTFTAGHQHLGDFQAWLHRENIGRASQLSPRVIDRYSAHLANEGLHPKSVANQLGTIRACLNAAVEAEILGTSPVRRWVMPKRPDPEIDPLTADEVRDVYRLIKEHRPALTGIVGWIISTGNRPSDACGLLWRQVDLARGAVARNNVKVKALRKYPISPAAVAVLEREAALREHARNDHVFLAPGNRPWTVNKVYHDFTRTLAAAGFRHVTLKDLRHTFGTLMANSPVNMPLPQLRVCMGHATIATTMQYVKATGGENELCSYAELTTPELLD